MPKPTSKPQKRSDSVFSQRPFLYQCMAGVAAVAVVIAAAGFTDGFRGIIKAKTESYGEDESGASITGSYLSGRHAANSGDFTSASEFLTRTQRLDPHNAEIAGYAYRMKLITGDMQKAETLAKSLYSKNDRESNPEIMILLSHIKNQDYASAEEVMGRFGTNGFNAVMVPLIAAWLDYGQGKLNKPLKMDAMLKRISEFAPFIYFQSALVNDLAGFEEVAIEQYEEALKLSRAQPFRVVELLANLHERRGEWDKAKAVYERYVNETPDTLLEIPDHAKISKSQEKPERLVKTVAEGVAEIFFSTASILHSERLNEEALIYVQEVLYLNPGFVPAEMMRGTVLEDMDQHEAALAVFESLPKGTMYYYKAKLREAYVLNSLGRMNDALRLLSQMAVELPGRYQIFLARGDILMREKRFVDAVEAYTKAIEVIGELKSEQWPILYARGISAERSGNWQQAEKDFLQALELEPDQPDVMNYLGYSWLVQDMKHAEARALIERAVEARPTDGHIIDSMGWALYTLGEFDESVLYLERAIELMPTDPTVNDHLGDVYWRMGRRNEARFQWNRALLFGPEPDQVIKLNEKLQAGLPDITEKLADPKAAQIQEDTNIRAEITP